MKNIGRKQKVRKRMILGVFLLLLGMSILLKTFFKIDLPVFRSLFAIFIIYLGVKMLIGGFGGHSWGSHRDENSVVFGEHKMKFDFSKNGFDQDYNVVFGRGTLDLTELPKDHKKDEWVKINVVFGEGVVLVDPSRPLRIKSNSVFGEARMPDESLVAFGSLHYKNKAASVEKPEGPEIKIEGNVVFGSLKFIEKPYTH